MSIITKSNLKIGQVKYVSNIAGNIRIVAKQLKNEPYYCKSVLKGVAGKPS